MDYACGFRLSPCIVCLLLGRASMAVLLDWLSDIRPEQRKLWDKVLEALLCSPDDGQQSQKRGGNCTAWLFMVASWWLPGSLHPRRMRAHAGHIGTPPARINVGCATTMTKRCNTCSPYATQTHPEPPESSVGVSRSSRAPRHEREPRYSAVYSAGSKGYQHIYDRSWSAANARCCRLLEGYALCCSPRIRRRESTKSYLNLTSTQLLELYYILYILYILYKNYILWFDDWVLYIVKILNIIYNIYGYIPLETIYVFINCCTINFIPC